jgi:hypothetical protein
MPEDAFNIGIAELLQQPMQRVRRDREYRQRDRIVV